MFPEDLAVRLGAISAVQHEAILAFDQGREDDVRKFAKEAAAMVLSLRGEALIEAGEAAEADRQNAVVDVVWQEAVRRTPKRRQFQSHPDLIGDMNARPPVDVTRIPLPSRVTDPAATRDLMMANGEPVPVPSCLPALLMALGALGLVVLAGLMAAGVIPVGGW